MGHNPLGVRSFWKGENDTERGIGGRERREETQVKDGYPTNQGEVLRTQSSLTALGRKQTPLRTS